MSMVNGSGPARKNQTWSTSSAAWPIPNGPSTGTIGTISALGKPPPGRDPKSRARSRDYLKQYVCISGPMIIPFC